MPRRHILTERQRHTLLALPTDEPSLLEHYTLAEDDLEHIRHRRRPHNRLGCELFAAAGETIEFRQEKVAIRMALTVNMVKPLY